MTQSIPQTQKEVQTATETVETVLRKMLEIARIQDFNIEKDEEGRRVSLFIYDQGFASKELLPLFVEHINHIMQLVTRHERLASRSGQAVYVDVNNYRRERERLIVELARAAARKAAATKQEVQLPGMNAYERRLVHVELAIHPHVRTESMGERKERHIVIRPIID